MKKTKNFFLLLSSLLFFFSKTIIAQPGFGTSEKINNNWQFILSNDTTLTNPPANVTWKPITLPHDWSVRQPLSPKNASSMGYLPGGIGWYKKTLEIPKNKDRVYIYFDGVYNRSEVFVNGHLVGKRPNGYISFIYDITPFVKQGASNEIIVKVDHHQAADSRWYTGSGIYSDVWLTYASPVHIAEWGVYAYPEINGNKGLLHVSTEMKNNSNADRKIAVTQELFNNKNVSVAKTSSTSSVKKNDTTTVGSQIEVTNPELWSLEKPILYKLKTTIFSDGKKIDESEVTTGFRSFTFDPDRGFALNGQWMKMKGVCLHHDAGVLGAAFYENVWRRRLFRLKEIGVNAIRTSHNPRVSSFYKLCDELGFLVIDEAFDEWKYPKRKWLEGWNQGTPGFEGSYDFFDSWGETDLADMVRRDRNHLSIFAWSIGNEVDYPNDPYSLPILDGSKEDGFTQKIFGGYNKNAPNAMQLGVIAEKLRDVVKKYDLSRPVTAGLAGVAMSNETAYPGALDIAGYNYTENRYQLDHEKYPKRVIYGSENRHDLNAWKAVTDNDFIFGQFLWTGIDYLGESGKWPSRGFYSGLIDFAGFMKPRGYFRQALWAEKPVAYIGTYPNRGRGPQQDVLTQSEGGRRRNMVPSMDAWQEWNYEEGQSIRVVCYTNTAKARLLLNGRVVGEEKNYDDKTGIIYWDIPYAPGELKVECLDQGGKVKATDFIETAGDAAAIMLAEVVKTGTDGVSQIAIQIVDKDGNPVFGAQHEVQVSVPDGLRLLGLEAGDNSDMEDYTDNVQKTFRGRLIGYFKTKNGNKRQKRAEIKFTSPGLKTLVVSL